MSYAEELHRAHKERQARMMAKAYHTSFTECPAPPQRRRVVAIPPGLLQCLREDGITRLEPTLGNAEMVVAAVAKVMAVTVEDLKSKSRMRRTALARQVVMWVMLVAMSDCKTQWVGAILNRDHTSVLHGFEKVERMREKLKEDLWHISVAIGVPVLMLQRQRTREILYPNTYGRKIGELDARKDQQGQLGGNPEPVEAQGGAPRGAEGARAHE